MLLEHSASYRSLSNSQSFNEQFDPMQVKECDLMNQLVTGMVHFIMVPGTNPGLRFLSNFVSCLVLDATRR
jgi:hypothetical protein